MTTMRETKATLAARRKAVKQLTSIIHEIDKTIGEIDDEDAKLIGWAKMMGFQVSKKNG